MSSPIRMAALAVDLPAFAVCRHRPHQHIVVGGAVASATLDGTRLSDLKVIWRQTAKTFGGHKTELEALAAALEHAGRHG